MKSGRLLYKCRLCGEIDRSTHVPNALVDVVRMTTIESFQSLTDTPVGLLGVCRCTDPFGSPKRLGVTDFVGVEEDE